MELQCDSCGARYRAVVALPLERAVRVACPSCAKQLVLKPQKSRSRDQASRVLKRSQRTNRLALIADEPRSFRDFLGSELREMGFEVRFFDSGDGVLEFVRETAAELLVLNVYLKGKLGVEISEAIKGDPELEDTRIVLIGALFRANRFRANPTNLYGADEYIEEEIPSKELRKIVGGLFPDVSRPVEVEPTEFDEARRLARLILSDIIIYNSSRVEHGIREGTFFEILGPEIADGREYYESRVSSAVLQKTDFFAETLQDFVRMKHEELEKMKTGTDSNDH